MKRVFIEALGASGIILAACRAAKINRNTAYTWRQEDPEFAAAWEQAKEDSVDVLEAELMKRARDPDLPGSTTALIFALKGAAPHKYREHVTLAGGVQVEAVPAHCVVIDDEAADAAKALRRRVADLRAVESGRLGTGD